MSAQPIIPRRVHVAPKIVTPAPKPDPQPVQLPWPDIGAAIHGHRLVIVGRLEAHRRGYRRGWRTGAWQGALAGALIVLLIVEAARRFT